MPYPQFTKIIINHFPKQHKSLSNLKYQHYHTIKDDGIVSRLKFVKIGEDYHEYGLEIPDVMLSDTIKQFRSYQMFIKYSTSQIPPKKSTCKGSQGKKTANDSQETIDVSEESKPEHVKRKTASRRVVKKKVTLCTDDNIIPDDPDAALELGKSIRLTEAKEADAARKVYATHARIVTESARKKSSGRSSRGVTIQDTPSAPKPKPAMLKPKLKGAQSLTLAEKRLQTLCKLSKKARRLSRDSQALEAQVKELILYQEKDDKEGDVDDEGDDHISDTKDTNDEDDETESDEDEIYKYKIHVSVLKNVDHSAATIATYKSQVLMVVDDYLGSKLGDALQKHSEDLIQKHYVKSALESSKIKTPTVNLEKGSENSASKILKIKKEQLRHNKTMYANKSFNRNLGNHKLYNALMKALIEDENVMDKGVADTVKDHKRKYDDDDDDEDPPSRQKQGNQTKRRRNKETESSKKPSTPKGKASSKGSKTGKSTSAKELVEEPIAEVVMDDASKDVVHDDDQPQDASKPKC
nr:hypothetical protein [Tanacetum cinerariifolium]